MNKDMKILHDIVSYEVSEWDRRTGTEHNAPYPADAPCYYCGFNVWRMAPPVPKMERSPCEYCIHNAKAAIYSEYGCGTG